MKKKIFIIALAFVSSHCYPQGFNTTANIWPVPAGGYVNGSTVNGFFLTANSNANSGSAGVQNWVVQDMNNDGFPDMIVTSEYNANSNITVFSPGSNPYWKVFFGTGNGFSTSATHWPVPMGGFVDGSIVNGFFLFASSNANFGSVGAQNWVVMDMNNDGLPDMVVTSEQNANSTITIFSPGSNPYWKVFLNNGLGFNTTAVNWPVPTGGMIDGSITNGFFLFAYSSANFGSVGAQNWVVQDMNNDGLPDMVVTSEYNTNSTITVFSAGSNPYWKVFLNNGSGFNTTAINWPVPTGGMIDGSITNGFFLSAYSNANFGSVGAQNWVVMDMNNDGLPDMVVTSEYNANNTITVFSTGSNPYWKVFLNTGSGFNTTAINWPVPTGGMIDGSITNGFFLSAYSNAYFGSVGAQNWVVMDMNNDGLPDMVVTSEQNANSTITIFSPGSNPYWKVFLNNGSGFNTTAINWTVPTGGMIDGSITNGFFLSAYSSANFGSVGAQNWVVMDMNNDGLLDMVVTSQYNANSTITVFNPASNPYWKVFLNNGITGFQEPSIADNNVIVYPNPFQDVIQVKSNEIVEGEKYTVKDNLGKLISNGRFNEGSNSVDLSFLPKGIYFLQIGSNNKYVRKIIKQ